MAASDAFYSDIVNEIAPLYEDYGMQFTVRAPGVYDEATMTTAPGVTRQVWGLVSDGQTINNLASQIFAVGEMSLNWLTKKTVMLRADSAPKPHEEIMVDGQWLSLGRIKPLKPANVVVLYTLETGS